MNAPDTSSARTGADEGHAVQRVVKIRRDYNTWVANETIEDYALRFTPRSFRKWPELRVANTAFGAASFLILEAVGATLMVQAGFVNAFWAIIATGIIIFMCGLPISYYAARHGVDMDLLTRGAGFGYLGSTLTSLIYASFTFIFFALEAAVMAYALELAFDIPPYLGYLICALVVIPLVTHGVTVISRLQTITQPIWLILLALPFIFVLWKNPGVIGELAHYAGADGKGGEFDIYLFGGALTVGIALITQMGEQADYLRFMPERTKQNRVKWTLGMLIGGPGWVVVGVAKMLGGCLLAYLAIRNLVPVESAVDPNQMYLVGFEYVFSRVDLAVAATTIFVIISQLKINVTNAYAGSLAWSNFFARLTHSHPGRVVWMVFNTMIALMLMELNVFQALGQVLGLYSNIAISWMVAVVADLVINKPLGLSPKGIEFRRAYLYDINPVGVGAMIIASVLSVSAHVGIFGREAQAFAWAIALFTPLVVSPLIAWATGGRYYLARQPDAPHGRTVQCVICERQYETDDMARCPAYGGHICSLCCSLDARCSDLCKPDARLSVQWTRALQRILPRRIWPFLDTGLSHYLLLMSVVLGLLSLMLGLLYYHELETLAGTGRYTVDGETQLRMVFVKAFFALFLVSGIVCWWLVLTHKSRQVAQEESNRQTNLLMREIESHRRTDEQLQRAKQAADAANQAKSRYITAVSHELRTPLNSILGYAQILDGDPSIPNHRQQAVRVIRKSGDHLLSLIEGTLDIARIESGKLTLEQKPLDFPEFLQQLARMFEQQAQAKELDFRFEHGDIPSVVRADEKRLRQILINLLANAVKFTSTGGVVFRLRYAREMATFEVEDSGPGISAEDLERIFEPFARGNAAQSAVAGGTGLGLTIARMLADVMGGELTVRSTSGTGTVFTVRLFLPQLHNVQLRAPHPRGKRVGYSGQRRRILIVDNEQVDRELLASVLSPLGFELDQAASGIECLEVLPRFQPQLIFMDLAMPGIDGWETIRRIRAGQQAGQLSDAHIAIISANAFDKGLENDAGIASRDFILKPVRVDELLDWIGHRLQIEWIWAASESPAPIVVPLRTDLPPRAQLEALAEQVNLGYVRGIQRVLDDIATEPAHEAFVTRMRSLVAEFQLDTMNDILKRHIDGSA
ncbi:MAG: ATP-binding protein [Moraxellaceae bacterium]|nr:ATP-binding protein [Moraxellaceae bacterium]